MKTTTKEKKAIQTIEVKVAKENNPFNQAKTANQADKKKQQVWRKKGGIYFYSAGIVARKNVFVTPEYMDLLVNAFKLAEIKKDVKNLAYVIMPNHFYWVFKLSDKQDNPVDIYKEVKKTVALEIIKGLCEESKEGAEENQMLDLFKENAKVGRSNPRRIIWTFKEEAKKLELDQRYRVWDQKSKLFLIEDEDKVIRNLKFVCEAPTRERWQLVANAFDYPYLYVNEDYVDKVMA